MRLVNSGTEATMTAIRLARGYTGRSVVVKFAGCYHGHVDSLLAAAGSGVATFGLPDSAGVPASSAAETIVLPYNDLAAVEAAFAARGHEIACVITEAAAGNMGVVPPVEGFTEGLLRIAHEHGALVVSDEVMTGFRCSPSGWYGLEGPYASGPPDLFTFGKVMGGGFPAAAFGGRADVMALLAPTGPVYQAGTLSGNPVATAAGLATLRGCTPEVYERLDVVSRAIADGRLGGAGTRGRPAYRAVGGVDVQRLLPRGAGAELRRRPGAVDRGVRRVLPRDAQPRRPPAAERVRGVVRQRRARRRGGRSRPGVGAGRVPGRGPRVCDNRRMNPPVTVVHLMRHGEVHNPEGILYGRLPGYRLSELGREMAETVARFLAVKDVVRVVASPLERAQETAAPDRGRVRPAGARPTTGSSRPATTSRARRSGSATAPCRSPRSWPRLLNPFTPSWGEPYEEIAARMLGAIADARVAAYGHDVVLVSHQLPVWTVRNKVEGKRLWHDPRKRECSLASLTSLTYTGDDLTSITYTEPAAELLARAAKKAGA